MELHRISEIPEKSALIVPVTKELKFPDGLPGPAREAVEALLASGNFCGKKDEVYALSFAQEGALCHTVLLGLGDGALTNRQYFLAFAKALKKCRDLKATDVTVCIDNVPALAERPELLRTIAGLPLLVCYDFGVYRSKGSKNGFEKVAYLTAAPEFDALLSEGVARAEGTLLARDLTNHPSMYMTPQQLAAEAIKVGEETGLEVQVLHADDLEDLGMHSFLAVGKGAPLTPPELIVLRHRGGGEGGTVGLVGKGIMYDSGGYSIKPGAGMFTMFNDMGGGAAVLGAMRTIAKQKLPLNVVGMIPACENKIGPEAYVPGDILRSMSGKTIEMLNTDAEGRLALLDAITYAIREEKVDKVVDIATLPGAAKMAVGGKTSAVMSNDDSFYGLLEQAAENCAEKVWRLDLDEEMFSVISSSVADIKNSSPGNTAGGGSIVAGLFLQEFVEDKPWIHIDCAPVNFTREDLPFAPKGATGYGSALLYELAKLLAQV